MDSDWAGAGGFRTLLEQAALPGLALDRTPPGWLLDPARHQPPQAAPAPDPHLVRMAGLVRRLLGVLGNIPMLGPDRLDFLLEQLAAHLPVADASAQEIRNGISEAARTAGLEVSPGAVNAVMHRIGLAGFDWQAPPEPGTTWRLRQALLDNIHQQMQQQRLELAAEDAALLAEWVGLATPAAEGFAPPDEAMLAETPPDETPPDETPPGAAPKVAAPQVAAPAEVPAVDQAVAALAAPLGADRPGEAPPGFAAPDPEAPPEPWPPPPVA